MILWITFTGAKKMGDVVDMNGIPIKNIPKKTAKPPEKFNKIIHALIEKKSEMDIVIGIGRRKKKKNGKFKYWIFENDLKPSERLDLAETLLDNVMRDLLEHADRDDR
jgi:hypothetical protein